MLRSITQKIDHQLTRFADFKYSWKEPRSWIVLIPVISQIVHHKQTSPLRKQYHDALCFGDLSRIKKAANIGKELDTIFKWHTIGSIARVGIAAIALGVITAPTVAPSIWVPFAIEATVGLWRSLKATEMSITITSQQS